MKKTLLILSAIVLFFAGCKKDTIFEEGDRIVEAVDLGLSVKWATCNVGASFPEDYGDYYAWGETSTKSTYHYDNSATYALSTSELQARGILDEDCHLTPQYDAATANWGGSWRMPTKEEQEELVNNCTWEWTTQKDVYGYKVTGPNGNSIFLPAAGCRYGTSLDDDGYDCRYWSSTPYDYSYIFAYFLSDTNVHGYDRGYGLTVRPVSE